MSLRKTHWGSPGCPMLSHQGRDSCPHAASPSEVGCLAGSLARAPRAAQLSCTLGTRQVLALGLGSQPPQEPSQRGSYIGWEDRPSSRCSELRNGGESQTGSGEGCWDSRSGVPIPWGLRVRCARGGGGEVCRPCGTDGAHQLEKGSGENRPSGEWQCPGGWAKGSVRPGEKQMVVP